MRPMPHTDFEAAFTDGTIFIKGGEKMKVDVLEEGSFCPASGEILACDPGIIDPQQCLRRKVKPGRYPVLLSCWDSYIACVKVRFSTKQTARWENAERLCDDGRVWRPGMVPGFGVDGGMGALVDGGAARRLENDETWFERFCTEFDKRQGATCQLVLNEKTGASLVACHAGYGDGYYPCNWGLDQDDQPTCLVVDFSMFVEGVYSTHDLSDLRSKAGRSLSDAWFTEHGYEDVRLNLTVQGKGRLPIRIGRLG
jgi:hypothetical protein